MTIKEMEARTGLARANIRFYEAEGLITPERKANGYRDYSEDDLAILQRVKLLRTLHMSLEEIKAVHAGDHTLAQALERHLEQLELDQADLQRSKVVCQVMQGDGVSYDTLDAQRYLEELERAAQGPPVELRDDQLPRVKSPWRRFFARTLDQALYSTVWSLLLLFFGFSIQNQSIGRNLLNLVLCLVTMFLVEPLLLSRFGTTPGKAILGLSVTNPDGGRLTYYEAYQRTGLVLVKGLGLGIPIYSWVRNYKSYAACMEGWELAWEEDSLLVLKDQKGWRLLVFAIVLAALPVLLTAAELAAQPPHNKGDITVAEFCENYNDVAQYTKTNSLHLNADGTWEKPRRDEFAIVLMDETLPALSFQEENGVMTGLSYTLDGAAWNMVSGSYQDQIALAITAFVCAQEEYKTGFFQNEVGLLLDEVYAQIEPNFDRTLFGVHLSCQSSLDFDADQGTVIFTMEKSSR